MQTGNTPSKTPIQINIGYGDLKAFCEGIEAVREYIEDLFPDIDNSRPEIINEILEKLGAIRTQPTGLSLYEARVTQGIAEPLFVACDNT